MDQTELLLLALVLLVLIASITVIRARAARLAMDAAGTDSQFAASTEGMTMCAKCGMGNLWTERRCSACGTSLKH
jgi:uncharacterized paraquat-inducible protein A